MPNGSAPRPARDVEPRLTDYEHERATFRLEVPERFNPVLAIVEAWAGDEPRCPGRAVAGRERGRHFVDELPKTVSGKIRRVELRGWLADGRLSAGGQQPSGR